MSDMLYRIQETSNAGGELLPEAGAKRKLEAVGSSAWFK